MAVLTVLHYPDERLRTIAKPVATVNDETRQLVADMLETMYAENGIGLAATQVNVHQRVVVIDLSEERNQPQVFINPEITEKSGDTTYEEGCLSVPQNYANVERASEITLKAQDLDGNWFEVKADGLLAICLQHELDHLVGKLFIDYLSPLRSEEHTSELQSQR